ncbi:cytochrome d ubiquinol oxidase subunit II [Aurantimonas sp. 22II-16-19i]|uniref:cytochrome d ubiquinol oxidase subunit II n=1 Tax=Aurantimonas sp. 22II-16-19i TaxID=1317114 RepID=UPI001FDA7A40|nr:cytochrome d ubiquinol oxidase subunit II [Aurantimonas sp. 22II-16-19i]
MGFIEANAALIMVAVIALAVVIYVVVDGFDLGIGMLFLVAPRESDRDTMMASIDPVWDGNETWLVFGGVLLLAAFPAAYYVLLPAAYLPVVFMLFGLILRGISFGFRAETSRFRGVWDTVFALGSLLTALCQGLILGNLVAGVPIENGMYAGGPFGFLTLAGVASAIGVASGYMLLGASWLVLKTTGSTQVFGREVGRAALILVTVMMIVVSALTSLADPEVAARWFSFPNIAYLALVPVLTALVVAALWRSFWGPHDGRPFQLSVGLFLLGTLGLVVSLWPYVVPRHITIWNGASDSQTLAFAAVGALIFVPLVLAYQIHAYWVFRGKVGE